jgi:X8 domain
MSGLVQIHANNLTLRPGYTALASQLASIRPSATKAAEYVPTHTADPVCHTQLFKDSVDYFTNSTHDIEISPILPVTPSSTLCSCMMRSLECFSSSELHPAQDLESMTTICQADSSLCAGILYNSTAGEYGAYNQCNVTAKTSWARNQYYLSKNKKATACASVNGTIQRIDASGSQDGDCNMLLRQAKPDGSGTITAFPASATGSDTHKQRNGSNSNSMNKTTKAGIITGVIIAVVLCFALVLYFAIRWKKGTQRSAKDSPIETSELPDNSLSMAGENTNGNSGRLQSEIDGTPKAELAAEQRWELSGQDAQLHELEAPSDISRKDSTG